MPERNIAVIACSFGLGLRAKEIASLTIHDVGDDDFKLREEMCLRRAVKTTSWGSISEHDSQIIL